MLDVGSVSLRTYGTLPGRGYSVVASKDGAWGEGNKFHLLVYHLQESKACLPLTDACLVCCRGYNGTRASIPMCSSQLDIDALGMSSAFVSFSLDHF